MSNSSILSKAQQLTSDIKKNPGEYDLSQHKEKRTSGVIFEVSASIYRLCRAESGQIGLLYETSVSGRVRAYFVGFG